MVETIADEFSHNESACHGSQGSDEKRYEHPHHALNQNKSAHPENTADYQAGNHEVQKVGFFHQHFCSVNRGRPEEAVEHQNRWQHQAQNGASSDFLQNRKTRTQLAEEHAHRHDDGEATDHVIRQKTQVCREIYDYGDAEKNREWDYPYFVTAQATQLTQPAITGSIDFQGLLIRLVHVAIPHTASLTWRQPQHVPQCKYPGYTNSHGPPRRLAVLLWSDRQTLAARSRER
ncbi:hypothetical protein D3C84_620810 [compost metagenome]